MFNKINLILICSLFMAVAAAAQDEAVRTREDIEVFLRDLENAVGKMDTYQFTTVSENWKGKEHEEKTIMFRFKKPNLMRTDVLTGKKKGSVVLLNRDGIIRGKNNWGLKKTLDPADKRLYNIRGMTFVHSSLLNKVERLKDHILKRKCKAALTEEMYMGRPAYHLHIDRNDADDPVTAEDVWFEKGTYLILKNLKYEGGVKVTDVTWQDHKINIPLDDALFEQ